MFKYLLGYFRKYSLNHGYTCDSCGREVFDYPTHRLCKDCENSLWFNVGITCDKCGRKTPVAGICLDCKKQPPVFSKGFAPLAYCAGTPILINRFKNGKQRLGYYLGELTAKSVLDNLPKTETLYLLPVPISPERLFERGYLQAQVLASAMQSTLRENGYKTELCLDILTAKPTPAQKNLDYTERKNQAEKRYRVQNKQACENKTFLLIDDILTTGATSNACAEKLLACGAKAVYLAVAAALPAETK